MVTSAESGATESLFRYIAFSMTINLNTKFLEDDSIQIQLIYLYGTKNMGEVAYTRLN